MNQSDFPGKKNPRFNENGQENPLDPGVSAEAVRQNCKKSSPARNLGHRRISKILFSLWWKKP